MESYRATSSGSQRGYTQPSRISRPSSNGAGSYGLSIRVQGIDGHPYVVLNNQDRGHHPDGNGYPDTEGSFIEHFQEYDFRGDKKAGSSDPFMEYRTQKMRHFSGPQNGLPESQAKKPSTLLNFQRHPELLQPYDPRSNSLNLEGFHSLPSRPAPQADTRIEYQNPYPKSEVRVPSRFRSSSLDRHLDRTQEENRQPPQTDLNTPQTKSPSLPSAQVPQPQSRAPTQPAQPAQPQIKPYLTSLNPSQPKPTTKIPPVPAAQPQPSPVSSPSSDQRKASPTSTRSANSSLERTHHDPDVLPLLRTDSGEPAQSCHSSLSSTSKSLIDEQMEALYTDAINRHENRRYIPFQPGSGRDIDTGSIPGVDELIEKFDGKDDGLQRRGRAGRRNRINPEDRKRSRSVDSAFGSRSDSSFMDEFGQSLGTSKERVLRPSQLRLQRTASGQDPGSTAVDGPSSRAISAPGSPQSSISKYTGSLRGYTKLQSRPAIPSFKSSEETPSSVGKVSTTSLSKLPPTADSKTSTGADVQATPDLLKGQQELSQQTHEETAKQILFSYLKEGSNDNDDVTNRKVNLVFEKIQTLKSRATASAQSDNKSVDLAAQTKALQEQNAELEKEIIELKRQLEEQMKRTSQADRRAAAGLKELQQELQRSLDECRQLKEKLAKTEAELNSSVEELFQVKMEREQHQTEIRDLQDQLSEMHDELDAAKRAAADGEKDVLMADMMQLKVEMQEVVMAKEEQEELLRRRERELAALKGALKDEVAAHDQEVDKMKEQYEKEISRLQMSLEEAKQNSAAVVREKAEVEAAKGQAEGQAGRLNQELERLRRRTNELENEVAKLNRIIDEAKLLESRLGDKAGRLEREKRQLEESLAEIREQEEEMSRANQMLNIRLEDVQKNLAKLDFENKELEDRLQEEKSQKEQFKNMKNNIEDERRLLDRTVEKLQREMSDIVEASQSSTRELQEQIDIYKEKNRRELAELQRLLKEKGQELEKLVLTTRTLQEKLSLREDELRRCKTERDEAVLKEQTLEKNVHDLEMEAEKNKQTKDDKSRQMKLMENRMAQLELDLEEERQSGDQLMDRIDRGREQVEQMRNELLQERSSRQDLECDKLALERQNKDLKSRVAHLEGSHQSNKGSLVNELEARVQELEEKLEEEEREKSNLSLANRRLERRVKEMMMQIEEEHHTMQDQKDQLNLRLKALKRQMDEAEETIDRLEHNKKKLHRELDEQQEANEQLNSQLKALRSEMRRKNTSAPLLNNLDDDDDDDDVSTDGEMYFSSSGYKRSSSQENSLSGFGV
ncbi:cingulin-like protein 1 isoform X1 [Xiphophorus couchianus]|uniref:cingulin-like protein 1 isoform X1 n=1 Tax=Xiphophorus couchianus TaxID=32473 RepID=UPI0010163AAD|nr:cingulin-like protein 1 isoform X1 [Xiphophorus couchianus]